MAVGLNQIPGCDPFHGITFKDKFKAKMASENGSEDYLGLLYEKSHTLSIQKSPCKE
jgi:hypothetical protein